MADLPEPGKNHRPQAGSEAGAEPPRAPRVAQVPRQPGPDDRSAAAVGKPPAPVRTDPAPAAAAPVDATSTDPGPSTPAGRAALLAEDDRAELTKRLQDALGTFVDDPGDAVRSADAVVADAVARINARLQEHRDAVRSDWDGHDGEGRGAGTGAGTEELRLALRRYRDLAQRLLSA